MGSDTRQHDRWLRVARARRAASRWLACGLMLCACAPAVSAPPASARDATGHEDDQSVRPAFRRPCAAYAGAPVEIEYRDAPAGAAVLYRTRGDVAKLRERIREVAQYHNDAHGRSPWLHDLAAVPHRASVEELEHGAMLVLTLRPVSPAAQDRMRRAVQQDVWHMQRQGCDFSQEAL